MGTGKARMLQGKSLQKDGMERWEIKKKEKKRPYFLHENLMRCSKPFCFSAQLEKELHAGTSQKCIVALMRKARVLSSALCLTNTQELHTKPNILAISETTHGKHIKPHEVIMLGKHGPNFIHAP